MVDMLGSLSEGVITLEIRSSRSYDIVIELGKLIYKYRYRCVVLFQDLQLQKTESAVLHEAVPSAALRVAPHGPKPLEAFSAEYNRG
jgi:hypothetical protein